MISVLLMLKLIYLINLSAGTLLMSDKYCCLFTNCNHMFTEFENVKNSVTDGIDHLLSELSDQTGHFVFRSGHSDVTKIITLSDPTTLHDHL